jgi:hypothetical protein
MPAFAFPDDSSVILLYRGKILDEISLLFDIEPDLPEFTVHCFVRPCSPSKPEPKADYCGFDRLLSMNYSTEQISRIRENFHTFQGTALELSGQDRINIEDEWYPALFSTEMPLDFLLSDADGPLVGRREGEVRTQTWLCVAFGIIMGFYLGVGALVFMALTFRNKKLLSGILLGSVLHYCIKSVRT